MDENRMNELNRALEGIAGHNRFFCMDILLRTRLICWSRRMHKGIK